MQILFLSFALLLGVSGLNNKYFPSYFKFGTATSAYQIEGAWNESGKGVNVWDDLVHNHPEQIEGNATGDVACDSYHKYEEDIKLLKNLNVDFYRFSISWVRILPNVTSNIVNQDGIDYYLNILKLLKENGIEPIVTLYHWDLPKSLDDIGGWSNSEIVAYFGEYARLCYTLFGDYVKYWVTLNEPSSTCLSGYGGEDMFGYPTYVIKAEAAYMCAYTHIKSHALAYHIYQDEFKAKQDGKISMSVLCHWFEPASNNSDDLAAHELAMQFTFGLFAQPIYAGNWPQLIIDKVANRSALEGLAKSRLPAFTQEEIDYINGTYDWFALNYYTVFLAKSNYSETYLPENASYIIEESFISYSDPSWPHSAGSPWLANVPWGLRKALQWVNTRYNHPEIIITENGWADDGTTLSDLGRIDYVEAHLSTILDAIYEDGVNVTGYTLWSLLDNFEWAFGYTSKFGLVSVNFTDENRTRTPKQSYYWYRTLMDKGCLEDNCVANSSTILQTSYVFSLFSLLVACFINKMHYFYR